MAENRKLVAEGKYSAIAEYLYENSLIPNFEEFMEEEKDIIKSEAKQKGYSREKLQYIIYLSINDGGVIRVEIEGREREDYINSFKSHNVYLKYNYVSKYGWDKKHQSTIFKLFQEAQIKQLEEKIKELREKNEELKEKIKEYENEENE